MVNIGGIPIFVNALCEKLTVWHTVERHPIKKKRRGWTVRRNERRDPCIYQTPQGIYMHPALYEQLRATKEPTP